MLTSICDIITHMKNIVILESTLPNYAWAIIGAFVFLIIVGAIIFLIMARRKRKSVSIVNKKECAAALGGTENVISKELRGSRIIVSCKDFSKVDHEALKKAGVTGFIQASDKLTLVIKEGAEELYNSLFNE